LAKELSTPIYVLKQTLPVSEVDLWKEYFRTEYDRYEKSDWYMAYLIMSVYQTNAGRKRKFKIKDFLLKFSLGKETMSPQESHSRILNYFKALTSLASPKKKENEK
jgi:hypothetical protein